MNVILEKCLKNCHAHGLDSLIIKDAPGMVRMFITRSGHTLYRNEPGNSSYKFSVAMHRHHCDVTLMPVFGEVYNVSVNERNGSAITSLSSFRYQSPISTGQGKFVPVDSEPLPVALDIKEIQQPLYLPATALHTILEHVIENVPLGNHHNLW